MLTDNMVTIEEFESQLQSQYISNKSTTFSSYATLIVAALAIIGVFGNVLIGAGSGSCDEYSLEALIIVTFSTIYILGVILYISLYLGFSQRYEQFRVYACVQDKNGGKPFQMIDTNITIWGSFLPSRYYPFGKKGIDIAQGLYRELVKVLFLTEIAVFSLFICKIISLFIQGQISTESFYPFVPYLVFAFLFLIFSYILFRNKNNQLVKKYHKLEDVYLGRKVEVGKKEDKTIFISIIDIFLNLQMRYHQ